MICPISEQEEGTNTQEPEPGGRVQSSPMVAHSERPYNPLLCNLCWEQLQVRGCLWSPVSTCSAYRLQHILPPR